MVITTSKWTRRKRCFWSKVVPNNTKNGLNARVETRKFLSFAHIVNKTKRQFWHQFHPNPDGNIHKIRSSLFHNKCHEFHCCFQRSDLVAKVNAPVQRSSAFLSVRPQHSALMSLRADFICSWEHVHAKSRMTVDIKMMRDFHHFLWFNIL